VPGPNTARRDPGNHRQHLTREMIAKTVPQIKLDDLVRLRKPHPCGSYEWRVVRLGTDVGLVCTRCGRRVLLPRSKFNKQLKTIVQPAGENPQDAPDPPR
jgi:hypothetical protein